MPPVPGLSKMKNKTKKQVGRLAAEEGLLYWAPRWPHPDLLGRKLTRSLGHVPERLELTHTRVAAKVSRVVTNLSVFCCSVHLHRLEVMEGQGKVLGAGFARPPRSEGWAPL